MIKIKNKISNSNALKKQRRFNLYMKYKELMRFKLIRFKPLNKKEIDMYMPIKFNDKTINIDKGKYLFYNKRIHILSAINKNKLVKFYNGYCSLVKEHPSKAFCAAIIDNQTIDKFNSYQNSFNLSQMTNFGLISPKSKDLFGIVDHIQIILFSLSDNYVGVSFILFLNKDFNEEINRLIISEPLDEITYNKFRVGRKTHINKIFLNKNNIRKEKIDSILLEIKIRSYNFLSTYFNLLPINNNSPITLDEYSTNYSISEKNMFLETFNFYHFKEHIHKNLDIIINLTKNGESKQKFSKVDFLFQCSYSTKECRNRSAKILYELPKKYTDNQFDFIDFLHLYTNILHFYLNIELDQCILKKNQFLYNTYKKKLCIFKMYIDINKTINIYNDILSSLNSNNLFNSYTDASIRNDFITQHELYNKIIEKDKSIDIAFSNLLMLKSNRLSLWIATISAILALFSLIVSFIFSE